jgi:hypothetical protein
VKFDLAESANLTGGTCSTSLREQRSGTPGQAWGDGDRERLGLEYLQVGQRLD